MARKPRDIPRKARDVFRRRTVYKTHPMRCPSCHIGTLRAATDGSMGIYCGNCRSLWAYQKQRVAELSWT